MKGARLPGGVASGAGIGGSGCARRVIANGRADRKRGAVNDGSGGWNAELAAAETHGTSGAAGAVTGERGHWGRDENAVVNEQCAAVPTLVAVGNAIVLK